jgi:bifunctional DNase/RNase
MIEMLVRAVDRHPVTRVPVAILHPRLAGACDPVALAMTAAEACSLSHELEQRETVRGQAFGLLERVLAVAHGALLAVEVHQARPGLAMARLRVAHAGEVAVVTVEVAQAIGLAVHAGVPLLVSEALTSPAEPDAPPEGADPTGVPAAFSRAFDD